MFWLILTNFLAWMLFIPSHNCREQMDEDSVCRYSRGWYCVYIFGKA